MRADIQPAGERRPSAQRRRLAGEVGENLLGDILGELGVTSDASQSDRINEPQTKTHQGGEGVFVAILNVAVQQLIVGVHGGNCLVAAAGIKTGQDFLPNSNYAGRTTKGRTFTCAVLCASRTGDPSIRPEFFGRMHPLNEDARNERK